MARVNLLVDFRTRWADVQKGGHSLAKWQVLFTDDPRARHHRRSVVKTCGASNFDKLLELVSDVIQSAPGGTELAPIFAFGDSTRAALRSHQDFAEKPFENFLLGCMPGLS